MIPISIDQPLRRTPVVNTAIIVINVLVALARSVLGPEMDVTVLERLMLDPTEPAVHAFLSYQFLHAGLMHLVGNMLFLWVFGNAIEERLGHVGYGAFYLAGGVVAGLVHALLEPNPVLGASGSVAAVTGLFLVLFPETRVRIIWIFFVIGVFQIPSLWFIGFSIARDLLFQIGGGGNVAYLAHLGGNAFGIAIGVLALATGLLPRRPYDLYSMIRQWNRRRQFRALSERGFNPWDGSSPAARAPGRPPTRTRSSKSPPTTEDKPPTSDEEATKASRARRTARARAEAEVEARQATKRQVIGEALQQGNIDEALEAWSSLLEEDPRVPLNNDHERDIATHLFSRERYRDAARAWQRLLDRHPACDHDGRMRLMLALTCMRYLGRPEEARSILEDLTEDLRTDADRDLAAALRADLPEADEATPAD